MALGLAEAVELAEELLEDLELALAEGEVLPWEDCVWDSTETWQADMARARIKDGVTVRIADSFKKGIFRGP